MRLLIPMLIPALCVSCHVPAQDIMDALPKPGETVGGVTDPATVAGIDVVEVVVYALAALGLGPVARILLAAKPILTPVLRVLLGKATAPAKPAEPPTPA